MAPVACLPMLAMSRLPDLQHNATKAAWADMEDTGTPSPWPESAADFKVWPNTPTPLAAYPLPLPLPMLHQLPITQTHLPPSEPNHCISGIPGSLQDMPVLLGAVGPAQMTAICSTGQTGVPLQHQFQTFDADPTLCKVNEPVVRGCEFDDWSAAEVGAGYISGVHWPSFAAPQHGSAPDTSQPLRQGWFEAPGSAEETLTVAEVHVPGLPTERVGGSELHGSGQCRPCAWFWRKQGCQNGAACGYCHLCPEGELKSRKKSKVSAMKMGALSPVRRKSSSTTTGGWGLKLDALVKDKL